MALLMVIILGVVISVTGLTGMLATMVYKREDLFSL